MNRDKIKQFWDNPFTKVFLVLLGVGLVFLIWYLISFIIQNFVLDEGVINIFFPGPEVVVPTFFRMISEKETYINISYTILRLILSFVGSFILAFIFGTIAGLSKPFETFFKPLVIVMRTLPPAVLILSLLMFMRYDKALFIIVMLVMFPILYEAIVSGYRNIDISIYQALRIETKVYKPRALFRVLVPNASPYILLGVVQTLGLGLKVSIMAEVLLGSDNCQGIGIAFYIAKQDLDYDIMFAYAMFAIIIIAGLDLILSIIKRKIKASM